jgi:hypothetical protein
MDDNVSPAVCILHEVQKKDEKILQDENVYQMLLISFRHEICWKIFRTLSPSLYRVIPSVPFVETPLLLFSWEAYSSHITLFMISGTAK